MSALNNAVKRDSNEKESVMGRWVRRVFVDPWPELVCAVIGLAADVVLGLVAMAFVRNGVIPTWLEAQGHLGWMVGGAVAALFLLGELPGALLRLYRAVRERLFRRRGTASELMTCPDCAGCCRTCGGDRQVPAWLADPAVVGEDAARSWGWNEDTR
jgi:hypothetical protein